MAKKVFWKNLMSSEFDGAKLVTGKFYDSDAKAEVHDGAIVVIGDLEDNAVYTGVKELNTRKITAPAATTDSIAVVDISNVTSGQIAGVTYRDGIKATDLVVPADGPVRVRRLAKGDTFWLCSGNFATAPTVGKYAAPTADSTLLTPADTVAASTTVFKIETSKNLIEGTVNTDTLYFCTVVALV